MSLSLQNQSICDTYKQLIHTGSSSLTGNMVYTAAGCIIPYCISESGFDYTQNGVINNNLTINTLLSGIVFKSDSNVNNTACTCIFGKGNASVSGSNNYLIWGLSTTALGANIRSLNSYNTVISSNLPTSTGIKISVGTQQTSIKTICNVDTVGALQVVGGYNNNLVGGNIYSFAGTGNRTLSTASIVLIGNRNLILSASDRVYGVYIQTDELSSKPILSYGRYDVVSGKYNYLQSSYGYVRTGCNNIVKGPTEGRDGAAAFLLGFSGDHNSVYSLSANNNCTTSDITIITGCYNSLSAYKGLFCTSTLFNGSRNTVYQRERVLSPTSTVFNGDGNNVLAGCSTVYIINGNNNTANFLCANNSSTDNHIITGAYNYLSGSNCGLNVVMNGYCNTLISYNNSFSTMWNGCYNFAKSGTIYAGLSNILGRSYNTIYTGMQNTLSTYRTDGICASLIFTGCMNTVTNWDGSLGVIYTGCRNIVNMGCKSLIAAGSDNLIGGGQFNSSILGGQYNIMWSSYFCSYIVGGRYNRACFGLIIGSNLSSANTSCNTYINNLIITDLPVGCTGLPVCTWYRDVGSDIIKTT
jgi:hypothetical protein